MNKFNTKYFLYYTFVCLAVWCMLLTSAVNSWGQITYTTNPVISTWVSNTCSNTNAANTCPSTHLNGAVRSRVSSISADGQNITFQVGTCSGGNFQSAGIMMGAWDTDYNCSFTTGGVTYGTTQNAVTFTTTNSFFLGGTGASYLFGVRANSTGQRYYAGNITVSRSFTSGIVLSNPSDNATNISLTPTLSWQAANGTSIQYSIIIRQGSTTGTVVHSSSWQTSTSYNIPSSANLAQGTTYVWQVIARFGQSNANISPVSSRTFTTVNTTCNAPTGLSVGTPTIDAAQLSWSSVSGALNYTIEYKQLGFSTWNTISNITATSYSLSSLASNTTYEWQIRTNCSSSSSSFVQGGNFTTQNCASPTGLNVSGITSTSATASWNSMPFSGQGYSVQHRVVGAPFWTPSGSTFNTSLNINGLSPATTYEFSVRNECTVSLGSVYSNPVQFSTTTTSSIPAVPTGLTTSLNSTNSTITISWNSVPGATQYKIYKNGGANPYAAPSSNSHPDFSVTAGTTQCYTVQACNSAGCSAQTSSSCVNVPASSILTINPSGTLNVNSASGSGSIEITANIAWTASKNQDWLSISPTSGNNNGSISYSYTANTSTSPRSATVTISASGLTNQTLTITQEAGVSSTYACHIPILRFPFANAAGIPIFPTIQWETVKIDNLTVTYELQNKNLTTGIIETYTTTTNKYEHSGTGLAHNTNYEYRVRGVVNGQFTDWTNWQTYKTYATPPISGCGSVMGQWLNAIVFRDVNTCSWTSCINDPAGCSYISGVNTGLKWECVEFIRRWWKLVYNLNVFIASGMAGDASSFLKNGPNAGLRAIANGTSSIQTGDVLVWGGKGNHVAVVKNVFSNKVEVIHQNYSNTAFTKEFSYTINSLGFPSFPKSIGTVLGWLRTTVNYSGVTEGQVINTTTPTISVRKMGNGVTYKLFIAERNPQTGCYSLYHQMQVSNVASTASNVNFSLVSKPLQKGRQYRYRINTVMPNNVGEVQNPLVYFSTSANAGSPNKVGTVQDGTKDVRVFAHTSLGGNKVGVSNATVAVKLADEWVSLGITNESGVIIATDLFPNLKIDDSIYVQAHGYKPRRFKADILSIVGSAFDVLLERDNALPNAITIPSILLWDNIANQAIIAPYSKKANVKLRITANGNSHFHLPTNNEPDNSNQWLGYSANSVIDYSLQEGVNIINVMFTNPNDTIFYSTSITYIPENKELDESYNVKIVGKPNNLGVKVYLNGIYIETLSSVDRNIRVPLGSHTFSFVKDSYADIFEIVDLSAEINLDWQLLTVLGNEEELPIINFNVFPNPTTDIINIKFADVLYETISISVQDLLGKFVINEKVVDISEAENFSFSLKEFPKGMYILIVSNSKGVVTRKILKH